MSEGNANVFNPLSVNQFGYMDVVDENLAERRTAMRLFGNALQRAWRGRLRGVLTRQSRKVTLLQVCREACALREARRLGTRVVKLAEIQGSEGRSTEFDVEFNPITERTEKRWVSVATARLAGISLPPVELLHYGDSYFVRDGHHRISVAHALGETIIEAEVIEMESSANS